MNENASTDVDTPVAWTDITAHCPVIASDGQVVGRVTEVAALPKEDIFHGVAFEHHLLGKHLLAPAQDISLITEKAVHLSVDSAAAGEYPEFSELNVEHVSLRSLFGWKHVGWKRSKE